MNETLANLTKTLIDDLPDLEEIKHNSHIRMAKELETLEGFQYAYQAAMRGLFEEQWNVIGAAVQAEKDYCEVHHYDRSYLSRRMVDYIMSHLDIAQYIDMSVETYENLSSRTLERLSDTIAESDQGAERVITEFLEDQTKYKYRCRIESRVSDWLNLYLIPSRNLGIHDGHVSNRGIDRMNSQLDFYNWYCTCLRDILSTKGMKLRLPTMWHRKAGTKYVAVRELARIHLD